MRKVKRWSLLTAALLVLVIVQQVDAGAPFKKVSLAPKTGTTTTTTTAETPSASEESPSEEAVPVAEEKAEHDDGKKKKDSRLTGIPQIDYVWDPNLPRELNGYNLSSYPFLSTTPPNDEIHFKCDGLHDGFYASIEWKCQVYHHCVYGVRHDFLCANFTAFDQRTFICHFASDVDCAGSQKHWNRNDNLYMATTTTTTTTTTTEPPPTQRRRVVRPLRPLRRPGGRRPIDDYYYEEEEYDEDYYEERLNRKRKQRPRHRKPVVDYEDEYEDEKRSLGDEKPRRPSSRDRFRDDVDAEEDYDTDRRSYDKPKSRNKPTPAAERRKISSRKPSAFAGRANADERRSFSDDRPLTGGRRRPSPAAADDSEEPVEPPRRQSGRRRLSSTASPASDLDDLDEYEKPQSLIPDQEEAAADEDVPPKVRTTPKPLEEFITPKAASSSVFARPRAPPRIARPVPVNEKNKFKYPIQKTATTSSPPLDAHGEEDYYEDEEYDVRPRGASKKRIAEIEEEDTPAPKRPIAGRKPTRTLRKPATDKKPIADEEDYDVAPDRYSGRGSSRRRNPLTGRKRGRVPVPDDVDFVDDDYDERPSKRSRPVSSARKGAKKPKLPEPVEELDLDELEPETEVKPTKARVGSIANRRKPVPSAPARSRNPAPEAASLSSKDASKEEPELEEEPDESEVPNKSNLPTSRPASVRVVKRPFLPSRGGSPYLPRGLQPVGVAHKHEVESQTTASSPMDMLSTISGVHLLEHGAPLLRDSGLRTTLPPRSPIPASQPRQEPPSSNKATLDELYENDYDVTLNDALNPTLKPLSPHQSSHYHQHHDNINRPYQSIYSPPSAPSVSSPSSLISDPFVYKNQSPSSSSSLSTSSSAHSQSVQHQQSIQSQSQSQSQPLAQSYYHHQQQQQQLHPSQQHQYEQSSLPHNQNNNNNNNDNNNYNSDSYFSSTDIRRRTVISAPSPQPNRQAAAAAGSRVAQNYYDEYEY